MKFLGVHYGHNATICLVEDGKILFCQSEERLNRLKNSTGFPELTADFVYNHLCSPDEIERTVLFQKSIHGYLYLKQHGFKPTSHGYTLDAASPQNGWKQKLLKTDLGWELQRVRMASVERDKALREEAHQYFSLSLRLPPEKVTYLDHHTAHAYSAIPNIQHLGRALILTLDGEGDGFCASVFLYENRILKTLKRTERRNSLGYYYAVTTSLLGMKAGEHEFKVMGLAPYAKPSYYKAIADRLRGLLKLTDDGDWRSIPNLAGLLETLASVYRFQRFDNIAGAMQEVTEELIVKWVRHWIEQTGCHDVAVAGGVFMNVKANQRVAELPEVDNLFVVPSAGDETCAIGGAVWASLKYQPQQPVQPLRDLYLGVNFDDVAIERAITETRALQRYQINKPTNINREIGRLLSENKIIARCSGPMEFGARALGNRSILANPSNYQNIQVINDAIKSRDFWMPFAPSILEEDMLRYVESSHRTFAPYMCITFNSTAEARRDLIAAVHPKDYTLRPQCVRKSWNVDYYEIISAFKESTGIGGVLNTSFNLHGEPIICSPQDAIRTVDLSGLEYLAMGPFLLTKR